MPARENQVHAGRRDGRRLARLLGEEIRAARLDRGLSQVRVAAAVGITHGWLSRIERAEAPNVPLPELGAILAAVGLALSVRAVPGGEPLRDTAHLALLGRLRGAIHPSLEWRAEVPLPLPGDRRAWDAVIRGRGWRIGVEAETRPRDLQALLRRLALKERDSDVSSVVLLMSATRHNKALVAGRREELAASFPVPGPRALELLRVGVRPEASALILA